MSDANQLMLMSERLHLCPDRVRDFAADVRVYLVEYEKGNRVVRGERGFDCEHWQDFIAGLDAHFGSGAIRVVDVTAEPTAAVVRTRKPGSRGAVSCVDPPDPPAAQVALFRQGRFAKMTACRLASEYRPNRGQERGTATNA